MSRPFNQKRNFLELGRVDRNAWVDLTDGDPDRRGAITGTIGEPDKPVESKIKDALVDVLADGYYGNKKILQYMVALDFKNEWGGFREA